MSHLVDMNLPAKLQASQQEISRFDYNSVEKPVAKFLIGQAERIRKYVQTTTIQIGKDLLGAKHYLDHGQFLRWVEHEVGMPARTAQAHMRVAQWALNKSAIVAHLPPTLLFILSAPSTPEDFTRQVLERLEAGEPVVPATVRVQLRAARISMLEQQRHHDGSGNGPDAGGLIEQAAVRDAILILFFQLPRPEFDRVKQILTSQDVLHDPELSRKILEAFSAVQDQLDENHAKANGRDGCQVDANGYKAG
jgi:hypothetical protein